MKRGVEIEPSDLPIPSRRPQVRPVIPWRGSKRRLVKTLLPLLPPHTCYVEPFAGGLALLLAKPRSKIEIVNDLNGDLVALYRCIQFHLPELLRELTHLHIGRQTLRDLLANPGLTDIQRAARFYTRLRASFGSDGRSFAVAKSQGRMPFTPDRHQDLLGAARDRLAGVIVECHPYERVLQNYDSPDTLFFLDPPYLNTDPDAYDGWTESDLETFRARVAKLKGKWIVTLDDSEFNRKLWAGCQVETVSTRNGSSNTRDGIRHFGELIIRPPQAA